MYNKPFPRGNPNLIPRTSQSSSQSEEYNIILTVFEELEPIDLKLVYILLMVMVANPNGGV